MLNAEQVGIHPQVAHDQEPLSYSLYLRVPELLQLQSPLARSAARDEMLFIIVQQVQELWFKQILHDLHTVIASLQTGHILLALPLIKRINLILEALADEVGILATMPPQEFHLFRHVLSPASGFESEQFRELEMVSGLNDATFRKLLANHMDLDRLDADWPQNLHDAFLELLKPIDPDPAAAVSLIYSSVTTYPELYMLAEALSEYEVLFGQWRFSHIKLVERTIGGHMPGTAGSSGAGYLGKTLTYRFFPELWEARNRLTAQASDDRPG